MVTFDPFREMDRLVDQVFGSVRAAGAMPMDLYRSGDHYVLHVDLPGVDPGSIDISVDDRLLTIRAQRSARSEQDVQWVNQERATGTFARQVTLGRGLDLDAISATYDDGVLSLTIPIAEDAKPRKIEVARSASATVIEASETAAA